MKRMLDMEFGAAELCLDDPLVQVAREAGWEAYHESFNDDNIWCCRKGAPVDDDAFTLSGSKTEALCVVYDTEKWELREEA